MRSQRKYIKLILSQTFRQYTHMHKYTHTYIFVCGYIYIYICVIRQQLSSRTAISKTIQIRRIRHAGHSWRSKDELISNVHLWTPLHGRTGVGQPERTYLEQLCTDWVCNLKDLPEVMDDIDKCRERVREIYANGIHVDIYIYCSRGQPEGSLFNCYYTEVLGKVLLYMKVKQNNQRKMK